MKAGQSQVMSIAMDNEDDIEISFGPGDRCHLTIPHSDTLVCIADIADCLIHHLFVDTGSAVSILYWDYLRTTGIQVDLQPPEGPLYGFSGEAVLPMGTVDLPLTLESPAMPKTKVVQFMVMELPNTAYNGILGRPALASFKAVVSITYLKMKFLIGNKGVGEVYGNQASSKECYVRAMTDQKHTKARVLEKGKGKRPREIDERTCNRAEVLLLAEAEKGVDSPPLVTTPNQSEDVELYPGKIDFITKIGVNLDPLVKSDVIACLRRHANIFAFDTSD